MWIIPIIRLSSSYHDCIWHATRVKKYILILYEIVLTLLNNFVAREILIHSLFIINRHNKVKAKSMRENEWENKITKKASSPTNLSIWWNGGGTRNSFFCSIIEYSFVIRIVYTTIYYSYIFSFFLLLLLLWLCVTYLHIKHL
jgi:hypothetical protein